ncbi:MAG TPA: PEP-CTERM sorting domain-containing protein [Planctomycetaceae bacterium]
MQIKYLIRKLLVPYVLVFGIPGRADASLIVYTEEAVGSGSFEGHSFSNALVTIQFTGNPANVTGGSGFFTEAGNAGTVTVGGIGSATLTDAVYAFANHGANAVGIADLATTSSILDTISGTVSGYGLQTAFGPVTDASFIRPDLSFATNHGSFNLLTAGNSTFTAAPVITDPAGGLGDPAGGAGDPASPTPEPGALALLFTGLASIGALGWLKRRRMILAVG